MWGYGIHPSQFSLAWNEEGTHELANFLGNIHNS